ncbi:hypothetical protein E2C01_087301 [Portunus trituberculatus]|uniref:Uncharacterized protein n=1 Tax=Portunus trituberculatus TaxID=210409 RepID=A0A5B7JIV1_PORTR|nr:hypothetical protein [Portunus trituberculatus]
MYWVVIIDASIFLCAVQLSASAQRRLARLNVACREARIVRQTHEAVDWLWRARLGT